MTSARVEARWLDLDDLFAPDGVETFKNGALGRHAMLLDGRPERLRGLADWTGLNRLMTYGGLVYPRLRLIVGDDEVAASEYSRTGRDGFPRLLVPQLLELLRQGAVLAIEAVDELYEQVSDLCRALEGALGVGFQGEMYASWREAPASAPEWNDDDVLLLQCEGRRAWCLFEPTADYPAAGSQAPEPGGEPRWEGVVCAGDLLYIPRGWWYRDTALQYPALYLALRFKPVRGIDMVWRVLETAAERPVMRMDVPLSPEKLEAQSSYLTYFQDEMMELCKRPGILLGLRREIQRTAEPRVGFGFPWGVQQAPAQPPTDHWIVALPRLLTPLETFDRADDGSFELAAGGRKIALADDAAKILERLRVSRLLTVAEIISQFRGEIAADQAIQTILWLINVGLVYARDPLRTPSADPTNAGPMQQGER